MLPLQWSKIENSRLLDHLNTPILFRRLTKLVQSDWKNFTSHINFQTFEKNAEEKFAHFREMYTQMHNKNTIIELPWYLSYMSDLIYSGLLILLTLFVSYILFMFKQINLQIKILQIEIQALRAQNMNNSGFP